ncbi:MAG TPA: alkaline phosphatase D family protein [Planctomycetaceae bacterium]|nr:alkaline phosphatase D family protein [Planctomycetaceae bacterium]
MLPTFLGRIWLAAVFVIVSTLLRADEPQPVRTIAFGSCAHQEKPQPIWEAVVAAKPDLFVFLGDNIYGDSENIDVLKAKYDKLAAVPGFQALKAACPILATWDDHDFGADDVGANYPKRVESQQLFLDFFGVPADSPRRRQEGVYNAAIFGPPGKRVQIILLDCRYHRSPLKKRANPVKGQGNYEPHTDKTTTILGEAQWTWLKEQLQQPAEVRLIGSSVQVIPEDHGYEKWMNFPHERERLFQLIHDTQAVGVVLLSGDRHLAELSVLKDDNIGYPLYDLTSSGLNQGFKGWRPLEVNRHRVATMNFGNNFGVIAIDWDSTPPRLSLQIRDESGDITIQQKVSLATLQPKSKPKSPTSPKLAKQHVGKEFTVEFQVRSTGTSKNKEFIFVNSEEDYREADNLTIVLDVKALDEDFHREHIDEPVKFFVGKKLRIRGTVTLRQERPQILVTDWEQLELLDQ